MDVSQAISGGGQGNTAIAASKKKKARRGCRGPGSAERRKKRLRQPRENNDKAEGAPGSVSKKKRKPRRGKKPKRGKKHGLPSEVRRMLQRESAEGLKEAEAEDEVPDEKAEFDGETSWPMSPTSKRKRLASSTSRLSHEDSDDVNHDDYQYTRDTENSEHGASTGGEV